MGKMDPQKSRIARMQLLATFNWQILVRDETFA
jgi:hypothetical protein